MIEAIGLNKTYTMKKKIGFFRKEKITVEAVKNLNLTIHKGEIVGLLGLNGAGKTTTIKMLSTLLSPTEGTITIDGFDTERDAIEIKKRINMIAGGERMLYWRLTGVENLAYFGQLYGLKGQFLKERIQSLIEDVGLKDAADTPVEQYSKGMKQRLQIARGLINNPDYLFLDEPTLGLDVPVAKQLRETIKNLAKNENKGILLTTHYLEEVEELCDRVYIIDKGLLIQHDTPDNIIRNVVKDFFLTIETAKLSPSQVLKLVKLLEEKGAKTEVTDCQDGHLVEVKASRDMTTEALTICIKEGITFNRFETKRPRLEDAILILAQSGAR
jgi:ABC-2 type transport system ATP-binding protein